MQKVAKLSEDLFLSVDPLKELAEYLGDEPQEIFVHFPVSQGCCGYNFTPHKPCKCDHCKKGQ